MMLFRFIRISTIFRPVQLDWIRLWSMFCCYYWRNEKGKKKSMVDNNNRRVSVIHTVYVQYQFYVLLFLDFADVLKGAGTYVLLYFSFSLRFVPFSFFFIWLYFVCGFDMICSDILSSLCIMLCICASNFKQNIQPAMNICFNEISVYSYSVSVYFSIILNSFFVFFWIAKRCNGEIIGSDVHMMWKEEKERKKEREESWI